MKLTDFKALTFDCYGTLIDWESGVYLATQAMRTVGNLSITRDEQLEAFARHESTVQTETPTALYSDVLTETHRRMAADLGVKGLTEDDHRRFGESVPYWPAFDDSAAALRRLKKHFQLVILSNVHRAGFAASNRRLGVEFDHIITAQDVGSYKPTPRNYEVMIEDMGKRGIAPSEILHTAESLYHDHWRAGQFGLSRAWIYRRHAQEGFGATRKPEIDVTPEWKFHSLAEMADAVEAEA
ncbi:MAG: haloacid dehalogenase type II [Alphaproteobacteria bacterium]|uniref:haloacid dehalogenase type II n=1 Tax=Pacificispira sp. TaxID=2888761 RepID=UPI001B253EF1|nr:haloacid dehalogenase type II [Alphaproteobacteria bacterium]MBO6863408.1 haloacid dehalogenase type II [Alphaproteobacteria bacterium]